MNNASAFSFCHRHAAEGLLLAFALLASRLAGAQNFVRNPNWALPLGPDNWTVVYGGANVPATTAADFWIAGRSTLAHRDRVYGTWDEDTEGTFDPFYPTGLCHFGGHFRPYTGGYVEAYFDQVVTNLTPGASYVANAWMVQFQSAYINKINMWLEALGGSGSAASGYVNNYCYNNNGWALFSVTNTADAYGQVEVRLHFWKKGYTGGTGSTSGYGWGGYLNLDGFYDHISVLPAVPTPLPPPTILSCAVSNQIAALNWTTIMNNTYDIQVSSDLYSWSAFKTNLFATGTNLTYSGVVTAAPALPQFFRVVSHDWVP